MPDRKNSWQQESACRAADADGLSAVIVLGHGSRAAGAESLLGWMAGRLAAKMQCRVMPASLQFNKPSLKEACEILAGEGVSRIVVAPYFLFTGNHLLRDIPQEIEAIKESLPCVELMIAEPLGEDERLVDVLKSRIEEALAGGLPAGKPGQERQAAGAGAGLLSHPIEQESFQIIDRLLKPKDSSDLRYQIARRVVHATGDPLIAQELVISGDAAAAAAAAFASKANIICDVNMVAAGLAPTAARLGLNVHCLVAEGQTRKLAEKEGITRGAAGIRRAAAELKPAGDNGSSGLKGAVVAIGNAPTALFECLRLARLPQSRPALVVGVPVGFVGAAESKQALMESGLPYVTLPGNRGGSSIAVAAANALLRLQDGGIASRQAGETSISDKQREET